jgi:hypothetical protein
MRKAAFLSLLLMTAAVLDGALVASAKTHKHAVPATAQDASTTAPGGHSRKATQKAAPDAGADASVRANRRGKQATAQTPDDDAPAKRSRAATPKAAKGDAPAVKRDKHGRVIAQKAAPDDDPAPTARSRNKKSQKTVAKADDAPASDVPAAKSGKRSRTQQAQVEDAPPPTRRGKHARVAAQQAQTDDTPPPVAPARKRGRKASGGYEDGYRDGYAAALAQLRSGQSANAVLPPLARGLSPKSNRISARALSEDSGIPAGPAAGTELLEKTSFDVRGAMPAPLKGSTASLVRQNTRLIDDGLERIEDEHDLESRIAHRLLVPVPTSSMLSINQDIPLPRRYCRPWTARFLADLARLHYDAFHRPLIVSSAVRTVDYQKRLMGVNGNAARAEGDIVSPHLTGAAVDLPKEIFSRQEMAWMRSKLAALQDAGKIDVEEEFQQTCFHITVYKNYVARPGAAEDTSSTRLTGGTQKDGANAAPKLLDASNAGQ